MSRCETCCRGLPRRSDRQREGVTMSTETEHIEERTIRVPFGRLSLDGNLSLPADAQGVVLFAHGSGSSRHSPRNRFVAQVLQQGGLATLLLDLLTPAEEAVDDRTAQLRFDIGFLAERLV